MPVERIAVVGLGNVGGSLGPSHARRVPDSVDHDVSACGFGQPFRAPRVEGPASASWHPLVSVILPIRNEAEHIEACLERLLEQDYPLHLLEILVVDGGSEDGTREAVMRVRERHPDADVRLLDNPMRTVPPALNIGIQASRGEVIVRMDGHTIPSTGYVSACIAALALSGAANVGGIVVAEGATPFGQAVALATQHPLGAGDAKHRVGGDAGDVDTVPFGAFRREVFERVGLFDESMVRNQDAELNIRIRNAGERIYFDPVIRFSYVPRGSPRALASQYLQYGWWKVETLRRHPRSLRWRQLLPPAFLSGMLVTCLAAPWWTPAAVALTVGTTVYLLAVGAVASRISRPPAGIGQIAMAFAIVHFTWALGFLLNVLTIGRYPYRAGPARVPRLGESNATSAMEVAS
jgi:succinoglycan biosynthesis protein ExoA